MAETTETPRAGADEERLRTSTARNFSADAENRIHSDDVAARFGFEGALVAGAAVFGHMAYPLVQALGTAWMDSYRADVRLIKPAYHGDLLSIRHTPGETHTVRCYARGGVLLAELRTAPDASTAALGQMPAGDPKPARREPINWGNVFVGEPFPVWTWRPDAIHNAELAAQVEDDLPCFAEGVVHPNAILGAANQAFMHRYQLPAWMHVGSSIRFRRLLRVGDEIEVRAVPTRKWRRKGHEFVDLYIVFRVAGELATEIIHTSIFKIAERPAA